MGNSPRYVGFLDPPYIVTLTDDSGNALDLTGCVSNSFTLTMLNNGTGLAQQGTGVWTVANQTTNKGQASYQWLSTDMATAGLWDVYTTVKLPSEPNPREFDPERMQILQGTVGVGIAPPGVVPGNFQPTQHTVYVDSYGADYTGVTDSTSAFQKALAALPTITVNNGTTSAIYPVGTIILGAGSYKLNASADLGNMGPFVNVIGPGSTDCTLYDYGQTSGGGCLSMHNAIRPSNDTFDTMLVQNAPIGIAGIIGGFSIDGVHAGAGRSGLDIGDFEGMDFRDLKIQHYNLSGSSGLNMNNKYSWVNGFRGRVATYDCTTHVLIAGNGGDVFNTYNDLEFLIYALIGQDGVTVSNGMIYQFGSLKIRGCFQGSSSVQNSAVLRLTGSGGGQNSALRYMRLDITAEVDGGTGSNGPYTIYYGIVSASGYNQIVGCEGFLLFNFGFRNSNWSVTNAFALANFTFSGIVQGDANLGGAGNGNGGNNSLVVMGGMVYPLSQGYFNGLPMQQGDFFPLTLTQNSTMTFQSTYAGPQRKTIVITQAASGGPYTVTWPKPGSPTLNSPAVYWAGGTTPTMTATANAVDKYFLETVDGIHWYGSAVQNLS